MAKVKGVNKTALVLEHMRANPDDGPKAVVKWLKTTHGLACSENLVYAVRGRLKNSTPKATKKSRCEAGAIEMHDLKRAISFIRSFPNGRAKELVDMLAPLVGAANGE